jgi:acyl carrier protein
MDESADPILRRVQAIVADVAGTKRVPDDAGPDTPLGDEGYWLDSVEVLEVILACEAEFGMTFESGADLQPDTLRTPRRLAALIRDRMAP